MQGYDSCCYLLPTSGADLRAFAIRPHWRSWQGSMISRSGRRGDAGLKTGDPADLIEINYHTLSWQTWKPKICSPDSFDAGSGVVVGAWVEGKHVGVPDDTGG